MIKFLSTTRQGHKYILYINEGALWIEDYEMQTVQLLDKLLYHTMLCTTVASGLFVNSYFPQYD